MPRQFIVEAEIRRREPDFDQAARKLREIKRIWLCSDARLAELDADFADLPVSRPQRVGEKRMQDVGQQQFLMLLFMIRAQFDSLQQPRDRDPLSSNRSIASST